DGRAPGGSDEKKQRKLASELAPPGNFFFANIPHRKVPGQWATARGTVLTECGAAAVNSNTIRASSSARTQNHAKGLNERNPNGAGCSCWRAPLLRSRRS